MLCPRGACASRGHHGDASQRKAWRSFRSCARKKCSQPWTSSRSASTADGRATVGCYASGSPSRPSKSVRRHPGLWSSALGEGLAAGVPGAEIGTTRCSGHAEQFPEQLKQIAEAEQEITKAEKRSRRLRNRSRTWSGNQRCGSRIRRRRRSPPPPMASPVGNVNGVAAEWPHGIGERRVP